MTASAVADAIKSKTAIVFLQKFFMRRFIWFLFLQGGGFYQDNDIHLEREFLVVGAGSLGRLDCKIGHAHVRELVFEIGDEFAQVMIVSCAVNSKFDLFKWKIRQRIRVADVGTTHLRDIHSIGRLEGTNGFVSPGIKIPEAMSLSARERVCITLTSSLVMVSACLMVFWMPSNLVSAIFLAAATWGKRRPSRTNQIRPH